MIERSVRSLEEEGVGEGRDHDCLMGLFCLKMPQVRCDGAVFSAGLFPNQRRCGCVCGGMDAYQR